MVYVWCCVFGRTMTFEEECYEPRSAMDAFFFPDGKVFVLSVRWMIVPSIVGSIRLVVPSRIVPTDPRFGNKISTDE